MLRLKKWLPLAISITVISGMVYLLAQQSLRMAANDPQVEMSDELVKAVSPVEDPASYDSPQKIDISSSLSAFWIVYDEQGKALAGTAQMDGQTPVLSKNALDASKKTGQSRITWQPKKGVRLAVVIRPYSGASKGFVVAGRSLSEVESREKKLALIAAVGWAGALVLSFLAGMLWQGPKKPETETAVQVTPPQA